MERHVGAAISGSCVLARGRARPWIDIPWQDRMLGDPMAVLDVPTEQSFDRVFKAMYGRAFKAMQGRAFEVGGRSR